MGVEVDFGEFVFVGLGELVGCYWGIIIVDDEEWIGGVGVGLGGDVFEMIFGGLVGVEGYFDVGGVDGEEWFEVVGVFVEEGVDVGELGSVEEIEEDDVVFFGDDFCEDGVGVGVGEFELEDVEEVDGFFGLLCEVEVEVGFVYWSDWVVVGGGVVVEMVDGFGGVDVYVGEECVEDVVVVEGGSVDEERDEGVLEDFGVDFDCVVNVVGGG